MSHEQELKVHTKAKLLPEKLLSQTLCPEKQSFITYIIFSEMSAVLVETFEKHTLLNTLNC